MLKSSKIFVLEAFLRVDALVRIYAIHDGALTDSAVLTLPHH